MKNKLDDISINTLVGDGSRVTGDLSISGFLRVDGDIAGSIKTDGVVITSATSRIRGNIIARSVTIGGVLDGNITARDGVRLMHSSAVMGNIITQKLSMEAGCIFCGKSFCKTDDSEYNSMLEIYESEIHSGI